MEVNPGAGRESVWDYPRPPHVELCERRLELPFPQSGVHSSCAIIRSSIPIALTAASSTGNVFKPRWVTSMAAGSLQTGPVPSKAVPAPSGGTFEVRCLFGRPGDCADWNSPNAVRGSVTAWQSAGPLHIRSVLTDRCAGPSPFSTGGGRFGDRTAFSLITRLTPRIC